MPLSVLLEKNVSQHQLRGEFNSAPLCLAPTDTSLEGFSRLLFCVFAFIELVIAQTYFDVKFIFIECFTKKYSHLLHENL